MLPTVIILALVVALVAGGFAYSAQARARREDDARRQRERDAREQLLEALERLLGDGARHQAWAADLATAFLDLCHASLVLLLATRGGDRAKVKVLGVAGACPGIPEADCECDLGGAVPNDFFWTRKPILYDRQALAGWLPAAAVEALGPALLAPLRPAPEQQVYVLIGRPRERAPLGAADQELLASALPAAELAVRAVVAQLGIREMEAALNHAHEEGMLQISTGVVHNLGNVVTVIQLALDRLAKDNLAGCHEASLMVRDEILPVVRAHLDAGDLAAFLRDDPAGPEYVRALDDLFGRIAADLDRHAADLAFIHDKFRTVTEIIALQQQFVGELGTENVVTIGTVLADVERLARPALEQREIALATDYQAQCRILVDPAIVRHILLVVVKHALESVGASRRPDGCIHIATSMVIRDERPWLRLVIEDNGAGIPVDGAGLEDSQFGHSGDDATRDMAFCRRRIAKYGGSFHLSGDLAHGSRVEITLPEHRG